MSQATIGDVAHPTTGGTLRRRGRTCASPPSEPPPRANTGEVLARYERVLVPELNLGQLALLLRARHLVDVVSLGRVRGRPFRVKDVSGAIGEMLA